MRRLSPAAADAEHDRRRDERDAEPSADRARYRDGLPQNLPAAANDALEWLRWLQRSGVIGKREHLPRCIAALEQHLAPHLPAEYEETTP